MTDRLGITDKIYTKKLHGRFFMKLNPTEHIQQQLFWYGQYEESLGYVFNKIIRPGDVFLDIGANVGYFSLLVANKVPTARIISFEPVRDIFQQLKENIAINSINNVTVFNAAVGEIKEEKEIYISGADNLGMSSFQQPENFSGKKEMVQVIAIDEWFSRAGLAKIDVIKLDIEGSELSALKGMKEVLQNFKPILIVEINTETLSMFGLFPTDIYDHLKNIGFQPFLISETGELIKEAESGSNETVNVLFVHDNKVDLLSTLISG